MRKPKPIPKPATVYIPLPLQSMETGIQLALNTYHENLVLIADLSCQISEKCLADKTI